MARPSSPPPVAATNPIPLERGRRHRRRLAIAIAGIAALAAVAWGGYPQFQAKRHWDLAERARAEEDAPAALHHLRQCAAIRDAAPLDFWPLTAWLSEGKLHFALARAARRNEEYELANASLLRAEKAGWPKDDLNLEHVLLEAEAGEFSVVENALMDHVLVGHHEEEQILEALIRGYLREHRLAEADRWARVWQERYPDAWVPHFFQGQAWELVPKLDQAAAAYLKVLEKNPDHLGATFRTGDVKRRLDQYYDALPYLERAHQRAPEDPTILASLLRCLRSMAQTQVAYDLVTKWLAERGQDHPELLSLKARLAYDVQRPDEAFEWFMKAERLAPNDEEVLRGLEALHRERGNEEEAERYKRRGDDVYAKMLRIERLHQQIRDDIDNPVPRLEAGQLLLTLGHDKPGLRWLKSVLQIDPANKPAHVALANYYESKGDAAMATNHRLAAEGKLKATIGGSRP